VCVFVLTWYLETILSQKVKSRQIQKMGNSWIYNVQMQSARL